jgi:hypothetical protein
MGNHEESQGQRPYSPERFARIVTEFQYIDDDFSEILTALGRQIKNQIRRCEPFAKRDVTQKMITRLILMQSLMQRIQLKFINRYS